MSELLAITICQPYAQLIAIREKPMENRTWPTRLRGTIAIHAGKSRDWLTAEDISRFPLIPFGAIVALADLYDCVRVQHLPTELQGHYHANGPFCHLYRNVRPLRRPVPCRGAQGFWPVPPEVAAAVHRELETTHV